MPRSISRLLIGFAFLFAFASYAPAQREKDKDDEKKKAARAEDAYRKLLDEQAEEEYRKRFQKPQTPVEYWRAMNFELRLGRRGLAAEFLKGLLKSTKGSDKELVDIEEEHGLSAFLRLRNVESWVDDPTLPKSVQDNINKEARANVEELIGRVSKSLKELLEDPKRIQTYIGKLNATPEERAFAIAELRRSGARVVPFVIESLQATDEPTVHQPRLSALLKLHSDVVPPLVVGLEVNNPVLKVELIDVLMKRGAKEAVPNLWFLSANPKEPPYVRKKATDALVYFLGVGPEDLLPAKVALTREAENYFQHKVRFPDPEGVTVWQTDGKQVQLPAARMTFTQAEEYYGLKYARQALELDHAYQPAQLVLLSLLLEKAYERTGIDKPLQADLQEILKTIDPDLVTALLERGLNEHRLSLIVPAVRALGELAEVRASRPTKTGPPALVRALNYPDRRVQMAAVDALLRIPGTAPSLPTVRVVEILRRAVAADPVPRVLVADANVDRATQLGRAVKEAGYEPVVLHTGRAVLSRLAEASDIDLLIVDQALPDPMLPYFLAQVRSDLHVGLLPVIVTAPPERERSLRRMTERYRNVWVMSPTADPAELKTRIEGRLIEANGRPLTEEERGAHTRRAMIWLKKMAVGEVQGYDIRAAEETILNAMRNNELALQAIEAAGRLPGRNPQRELAAVVLDKARPSEVRAAAAEELVRHIQQHGLVLTKDKVALIEELYATGEDSKLKPNVALLIGTLRPNASQTGTRLQRFTPSKPAPPEPPKEK